MEPPRALFWIRLFLGGVFVWASIDKILHLEAFAHVVYNYQILPDGLINFSAIALPWLELFLGFLLISGFWLPGAVVLSNLLLVTFFAALAFNVIRGLDVHCGCFATSRLENPKTLWYLIRDAALIAVGGYLLFNVMIDRKT